MSTSYLQLFDAMVFKTARLKRRHQSGDPSQPSSTSKQQDFLTTAINLGNIDAGMMNVELSAATGEGAIESGVEASCASLTHSAATSSPGKSIKDGASVGFATDMMKCKHATNAMKICMKINTKANARKRGIKTIQLSSVLSQARDDCASSRKITWPSFERRSGNTYDGGEVKPKSCLKPKRSNAFFGSRISRRSFGSGRKLTNHVEAKKVHFKESISVSCSDGVESIASSFDDAFVGLDYFDDDDDDSFIDDSRYSDSQGLSETGCQACTVFYPPGSQPALFNSDTYNDYIDYNSDLYSVPTPRRQDYNDPLKCDVMDKLVILTDAKNKSQNANTCEKVNAGLSNSTALLLDSCGLCIRESPDECTSLSGEDDEQIIHHHNFEHRIAPTKICNRVGYGCTPVSPATHHAEDRDDIESSFNELGTAAITNLERVMEVVDDVLFPVGTQIRSRHEEVGATSNKDNSSPAARSLLNDSIKKSKSSLKSNKGIIANNGVTAKKDVIVKSALSKDSIQVSKRSSKLSKASKTNNETAEIKVVNPSIHNDDLAFPWLYKIMDEINNDKFVSWTDWFKDPASNDNAVTEHSVRAKKLDKFSAGKVSKERTCTIPESISSKMRNLFKNGTTMNKVCVGAPEPINSIEPVSQSYFPAGKREPETNNTVQPFTGVYDATCRVPKYILASDDGYGAISSWRDAVTDTVEFTPHSTSGNMINSQVHTQQQQEFYPSEITALSYLSSSRFPPLSTLNYHSSHRASTQIKYDPLHISPRGNSSQSNPIRDRYCHNMNSEVHPWQELVVPPHIGIISETQHLCPSVPIMSRLPYNIPSVNSNLSEVSANAERDRYAGMEQQDTMAEKNDQKLLFPGPRHQLGSQWSMMDNNNNAYPVMQFPHLHVQYNQFDRGRHLCQHRQ